MSVPVSGTRSEAATNPQLIRDWAQACAEGLTALRGEINDLNVFPIPDADTGSNMAYTMVSANAALDAVDPGADLPTVTRALAEAGVKNARGNSGVILSQILVGLADAADLAVAEGDMNFNRLCANGLRLASLGARRAVADPREGTVLTVLEAAAKAAGENVRSAAADLVRAIADDSAVALDETPHQMPELARAGVVDAGARGFLVLVDAMVRVVTGVANKRRTYRGTLSGGGDTRGHPVDDCSAGDTDFEVMYILGDAQAERIVDFRERLNALGDSVVVVGDSSAESERFSVHVHTNEPGLAVEVGIELGNVSDVRISCFMLDAMRAEPGATEAPPKFRRAVVAVVAGEGAAELFEEEGAKVVMAGDAVEPAALAEAIRNTDSAHVVVMGNGMMPSQDMVAVGAETRSTRRSVVFLPTLSMVQCLAALAVHDPADEPDADAFVMAEAAAGTRWGTLKTASETMMTLAGTCTVGDTLGLVGDDVLVIKAQPHEAATSLIDMMLATGGELVTVLAGAELDTRTREVLTEHIRVEHPGIELSMFETGQTGDLLQIGIE